MSDAQLGRGWIAVAGISGFLAVAAGAFGAHGLEGKTDAAALAAFKTGALYHLVHSVALLALCALPVRSVLAAWSFVTGMILFSGSLYFLGITGSRALVLITPLGGVAFLIAWLALTVAAWHTARDQS